MKESEEGALTSGSKTAGALSCIGLLGFLLPWAGLDTSSQLFLCSPGKRDMCQEAVGSEPSANMPLFGARAVGSSTHQAMF